MSNELLIVHNVYKDFGNTPVLRDVSLALGEGELVSILGKSGAGKSTLFSIIAGLSSPDEGGVYLRGNNITNMPGNVGYMLQKDLLLPFRTVGENVILPMLMQGIKKDVAFSYALKYFKAFGLEGTENKWPAQLSGGMRQRAALLRTYLFGAEVALLDEPFSALDAITRGNMHDWYLNVMQDIRLSTLFITHDVDEALMLSDRILILAEEDGKMGATITNEIAIDVPRPRSQAFSLTQEYLDLKAKILL